MKTYTIGTSWKRLLAVSAILSAVLTGYSGGPLAATHNGQTKNGGATILGSQLPPCAGLFCPDAEPGKGPTTGGSR